MIAGGMTVAMLAMGSIGANAQESFDPEGCWPEDAAIAPDTESENVFLFPQWETQPDMVIDEDASYTATISTNKGDLVFDLNVDAAPVTVNNFICLATNDFYTAVPFHRVIADFMVQSGDPTGTGSGGPGYRFEDELPGEDLNYTSGSLAMANAGPNTQGSQFFITHGDQSGSLDKNYTIFGQLVDGESVLNDIADTMVVPGANGEPSRPVENLVITGVTVVEE